MQIKKIPNYFLVVLGSFACGFISELIYNVGRCFFYFLYEIQSETDVINSLYAGFTMRRFLIFSAIFIIFFFALYFKGKQIGNFIYKYRHPIAFCIFILCVALKLSGSSIGCWNQCLGDGDISNEGVIWGISRQIRCDEWATNTPMAFSQQFNSYNYFSEIIRGDTTDSFIVYGQPVISLAEIFRPFHWGYILLGSEMGLSFFWCGRFIALFMVSFEFSMMFFKKSKPMSVLYAVFVAFAPVVQWWFAINGLAELFIFGQLAVIMVNMYMITKSYKMRILFTAVTFICAGGFILVFYPAWQIPLAYIFLALAVAVILRQRKTASLSLKKDGIILLLFIILLALSIGMIFMKSYDTIQAVMNTEYPCRRALLGGDEKNRFFAYLSNLMYSFDGEILPNVCEQSVFFDFFPLGILMAAGVMIKNKKADIMLVCLLIVNAFLISYCVIEYTPLLADITLLSHSSSGREFIVITFVNVLLVFRASAVSKNKIKAVSAIVFALIFTLIVVYCSYMTFPDYMVLMKNIICGLFLFCGVMIFLAPHLKISKNVFIPFIIVFLIFTGSLVNPVRVGTDAVSKIDTLNKVSDVVSEDKDAKWIFEGVSYPCMNLLIMAGAPTINSTNVYPDMKRWETLDTNGEYTDVYNRYAHISIKLNEKNDKTYFELTSLDTFTVNLNVDDLRKLDVSYLVSPKDLTKYSTNTINFVEKDRSDIGMKIFAVEYMES